MSRFYLTLLSNSSMDYSPQNTVAKYTTTLNSLIEVDGEWEVGLTEASFPFHNENALEADCYFILTIERQAEEECGTNGCDYVSVNLYLPARHYATLDEVSDDLHSFQSEWLGIPASGVAIQFDFNHNKN